MQDILDVIMEAEGTDSPDLSAVAAIPVPDSYQAVVVRAEEAAMFDGMASRDKDPRKSLHVQEVPTPELGPGEALGRGDGKRDQLQHRLDVDLRAGLRPSPSCSGTAGSPS